MVSNRESLHTEYGNFQRDFKVAPLWKLCSAEDGIQTGPFGSQLHQRDYVPIGTPIITVEHLGDNRIVHRNLPCVSDEDKCRLSKYTLRKGDIVFSRVGSVDRRSLVSETEDGWLFSGRCLRVRPDPRKVDSTYLSYFLGLPAFRAHIRAIAVGATMPSLNTKLLSNVSIVFPPLAKQRRIAHILGTLDEKIELNRRMNATLETMARALFKSWFVAFEPVRAKMEGRWRRGESLPGMPAELWDAFPMQLVPSELGEVPEGWEIGKLGDIATLIRGRSYKSAELAESDTALVSLKSFRRGGGYQSNGLKPYTGRFRDDQVIEPGEVVIACTDVTQAAEVVGKPAMVQQDPSHNRLVASLDTMIVRPTAEGISNDFLYFLCGTQRFADFTYAHTTGTTVLHLVKDAVPMYQLAIPPIETMIVFRKFSAPLFEKKQLIGKANYNLRVLRDRLLPKLVSGELQP